MELKRATEARADGWWLTAITLVFVAAGMAYSLCWAAIVRHHGWYWIVPGDMWATVRGAHWIDWGSFSYIYSSRTALVTLPGFNLLLAPFVALSSHLHLAESAPGLPGVPKPSSWFLLGPVFMACAAPTIVAADALARRLGATLVRRRIGTLLVGAAVWPAIVIWGHPEDVLALGLALFAVVALSKDKFGAAGWLLGAALGLQLYTVVLIPLFVAVVGRRYAGPLLARAAILPGFLFVAVVVPNPHASLHALLDQPNFPAINHATPWALVAPTLARGTVAAGPGRVVGLVLAVMVGSLGIRSRHDLQRVVWLAAAVLGLRCVFESVMVPYYVMPLVVFALLAGLTSPNVRFIGIIAAGAALTVVTHLHGNLWLYWSGVTSVSAVLLLLAWPRASLTRHAEGIVTPDADGEIILPRTVATSA